MATVTKIETLPGRTGDGQVQVGQTTGSEAHRYRVYFDGPDATGEDAKNASVGGTSIPAYWATLGAGSLYVLLQKGAEQLTDEPRIWIVTCTYQIPQPGQNNPTGGGTKWNIKISGNSVPYEQEIYQDLSHKEIANSAGDMFTPVNKTCVYDERLVVSYDTTAPDWSEIAHYPGYINLSDVTLTINGVTRTFAAKCLKYEHFDWGGTVTPAGSGAINVTLQFLYRYSDWRLALDQRGYYFLDGDGKKVPFKDANGNPQSEPGYLDGTGHAKGAGADVVKAYFNIFPTHDFSTLLTGIGT